MEESLEDIDSYKKELIDHQHWGKVKKVSLCPVLTTLLISHLGQIYMIGAGETRLTTARFVPYCLRAARNLDTKRSDKE